MSVPTWPEWVSEIDGLASHLEKRLAELKTFRPEGEFEIDERVNHIASELERSIDDASKYIKMLFSISPVIIAGTIENEDVKKARESLFRNAKELFDGTDYSTAVNVGMDYETFRWALRGARLKIQEFRLFHQKPGKGRRKSDSGKQYLAWMVININEELSSLGIGSERRDELIQKLFDAAGQEVPSESTIKRAKRNGGAWRLGS